MSTFEKLLSVPAKSLRTRTSAAKLSTQLEDHIKEVTGHPDDDFKEQMLNKLNDDYAPRIERILRRAKKTSLFNFLAISSVLDELRSCKSDLKRDFRTYTEESTPARVHELLGRLTVEEARMSQAKDANSSLSPGVYPSQGDHVTPSHASQGQGSTRTYGHSDPIQSPEERRAIDNATVTESSALRHRGLPPPPRKRPIHPLSDPQTTETSHASQSERRTHQSTRSTSTTSGEHERGSNSGGQSVAARSRNSWGNESQQLYSSQHGSMQRSHSSGGHDGSSVRSGGGERVLVAEDALRAAIPRVSVDSQDLSGYLDGMSLGQGGQTYPPQSQSHHPASGALSGSQARHPPPYDLNGNPFQAQGYAHPRIPPQAPVYTQPSYSQSGNLQRTGHAHPGIPPQAPVYAQPSYGQSGTLQTAGYGQPTYGHALPPTHMPATYQHPQQMGGWPGMGTPGHVAPGTQPYGRYDASGSGHYPPGAGSSSDKGKYDYPYGGR